MKKNAQSLLAIVILSVAAIGTMNAQIGIHAGYVNSKFSAKAGDSESVGDPFNGFEIGLDNQTKIIGNVFSVKYGLNYTFLTAKETVNNTDALNFNISARTVNHYLDIPIHLQAGIPLGFIKIFAYGGPKFVMGLSSKSTFKFDGNIPGIGNLSSDFTYNNYNGKISSSDLSENQAEALNKLIDKENSIKRFDIQMGVGVGVELFDMLNITAGYDWGLLNLSKIDNTRINRNQFNITVGVSF